MEMNEIIRMFEYQRQLCWEKMGSVETKDMLQLARLAGYADGITDVITFLLEKQYEETMQPV